MADLIYRDAVLHDVSTECSNAHEAKYYEAQVALTRAKKIIRDAPAVNRWIPCSERLPELDTMVIVCYYGSDCIFPMQGETVTEAVARQNKVPTVTMGFLDEEGWNGADMFPMMVQPTFWMNLPDAPLPEPPEQEQ